MEGGIQRLWVIGAILGLIGGIAAYFLPAIVAKARRHSDYTSILLVNLLLGWTFLGWVVALVWAFKNPATMVLTPHPVGLLMGGAGIRNRFCPQCGRQDLTDEELRAGLICLACRSSH